MNPLRPLSKPFLGRGIGFPPTFSKEYKDLILVQEEEDIRQSLHIILSTQPGERVLQQEFGCDLQEFLFEPLTLSLLNEIQDAVTTSLIRFEPRINVEYVDVLQDAVDLGRLDIDVEYLVRSTNSRYNFVYPFYLTEGTDLSNQALNTVKPLQ